RDVAHLTCEVAGHGVDVVRQVFPGAGRSLDVRLAAEPALGTRLARHARYFAGEGIELVDHDVDGVLQLENLALHLDGDLLGEVALLDGGRDLGDVAHLGREVGRELIHLQGQVFPGPGRPRHAGLTAEPALGADLARHPGDFRDRTGAVNGHHIDGVLELEDLALHFDGDLLGKIALLHGGRDVGDIAHLRGQVARHEIHVVGEVLPDATDAAHLCLAAQLALGANLACHPGDFRGERVELIHHGVDGILELQDLAANVNGDLLRQVAPGDGGRDVGDVAHLGREIGGHQVDVVGEILPDSGRPLDVSLPAQLSI